MKNVYKKERKGFTIPSIISVLGYRIYFWTNEGDPLEPVHVHISKTPHANATKIWLLENGTVEIENNNDKIPPRILRKLTQTIYIYYEDILDKWQQTFGLIEFKDHNDLDEI